MDATAFVLIRQFEGQILAADGRPYKAEAWGHQRGDGTWVGWLEFRPADGILRTERDTTQPDRDALADWASGIEPTYLDAALGRARPRLAHPPSEQASEDDLDFSGMPDDELSEIVNSRSGDYPQTVVDGAKNELKKREDAAGVAGGSQQFTTGEPPPPVLLSDEAGGKLYSVGQITLATYLGAPLAGALILARNHQALVKSGSAWRYVAVGGAATILLTVLAFILPENFPKAGFYIVSCGGMYYYAKELQGDAIDNHLKAGGGKGSWAVTVLVAIICAVIIFGLLFALYVAYDLVAQPIEDR